MSAAHVEAVRAYIPQLCSYGASADPAAAHDKAANLAFSLALVAECGPAAVATGPDLHGLFAALAGPTPPVRTCGLWC